MKREKPYPNIPKPRPNLQILIRIPCTPFSLNLTCPCAVCHRLEFLSAQDQTSRDQNDGNQRLYCDIERDNGEEIARCCRSAGCASGEGDVAVECCVFVGRVSSDCSMLDFVLERGMFGCIEYLRMG